MREDFLYYVWKFGKLSLQKLQTTDAEPLEIVHSGTQNLQAGPDFFNAQLRINGQLWAGNVEMHVNASDWYVHRHEKDANYDNVILHVVWHHDVDVYRKDNSIIPTFCIGNYTNTSCLQKYHSLTNRIPQWILCENDFPVLENFQWENWIERLYFERLEKKCKEISVIAAAVNYDWEAVLFQLLAKSFGLKLNSEAFFTAATSVPFSIIRKLSKSQFALEAFLFGIFGMLDDEIISEENYFQQLREEFNYQKHKFNITQLPKISIHFYGTRPPNFPTIRASQLATLYHIQTNLFSELMQMYTLEDFYKLFNVATSAFWKTHYTFSKTSRKRTKLLSKKFIDVLLINTIIPLKYSYQTYLGNETVETILKLLRQIQPEQNQIIKKFSNYDISITSALETQSLLELKKSYCDAKKCLQCAIGLEILRPNKD